VIERLALWLERRADGLPIERLAILALNVLFPRCLAIGGFSTQNYAMIRSMAEKA
jgi:ABC-type uncharacterized transport system permease subunit